MMLQEVPFPNIKFQIEREQKKSSSVNKLWARMACVNEEKTRTSHPAPYFQTLWALRQHIRHRRLMHQKELGYESSGYPIVTAPPRKIHVAQMNWLCQKYARVDINLCWNVGRLCESAQCTTISVISVHSPFFLAFFGLQTIFLYFYYVVTYPVVLRGQPEILSLSYLADLISTQLFLCSNGLVSFSLASPHPIILGTLME